MSCHFEVACREKSLDASLHVRILSRELPQHRDLDLFPFLEENALGSAPSPGSRLSHLEGAIRQVSHCENGIALDLQHRDRRHAQKFVGNTLGGWACPVEHALDVCLLYTEVSTHGNSGMGLR